MKEIQYKIDVAHGKIAMKAILFNVLVAWVEKRKEKKR